MNRSIVLSLIAVLSTAPLQPSIATAQPIAPTIAQASSTDEIDRSIEEGLRLFQEGSAESLKKAIAQFEKALGLARCSCRFN
jgi:hypothetical protein